MHGARLRNRHACGWIEQGEWPAARLELQGVRATPELSPLEEQQSRHLLALLDLRSGADAMADHRTQMIDGRLVLAVDPWYAPQAPATAEAAWLRSDRAATLRIARAALPVALQCGERWRIGQLACWLRRGSEAPAVATACVSAPCALKLAGDARGADAAWSELGCRYEQGLALLAGDAELSDVDLTAFATFSTQGAPDKNDFGANSGPAAATSSKRKRWSKRADSRFLSRTCPPARPRRSPPRPGSTVVFSVSA